MTETQKTNPALNRLQFLSLVLGVIGLALSLLGLLIKGQVVFFQAYLIAYMLCFGFSLGSLALLMLQHLTGGGWSLAIRRQLEAGARMLPIMVILFVPVVLGIHHLYIWDDPSHSKTESPVHPGQAQHSPVATAATTPAEFASLENQQAFKDKVLNRKTFIVGSAICFGIWILLSLLLNKWSSDEDTTGNPHLAARMQKVSGPGILIYGLTITFAAVSWVMSIDPHWYSTIYGMVFIVGQGIATLALMIIVLAAASKSEPLRSVVKPQNFYDLGNLLMAFTMLYAYVNFSQFLIIWAGNIAEETPYYVFRGMGPEGPTYGSGWQYIGLMLVILHFFVPFGMLLHRRTTSPHQAHGQPARQGRPAHPHHAHL
jgi:hypothetical protein